MKSRRLLMSLAPAALLLGISTVASAGIVANATFGYIPVGTLTVTSTPPNDLMNATSITVPGLELVNTVPPTAFGDPNSFFGSPGDVNPGDFVTQNPLTLDLTGAFSGLPNLVLFGSSGHLSFSATSQVLTFNVPTRAVSLYFLGTFHDSTGVYDDAAASLTFSFNQSSPGTTINGSATFSTPPDAIPGTPEPASMALLGSALIGLGVIGRKRLARN